MGRKFLTLLLTLLVIFLTTLVSVACGDQTATPKPPADATVAACLPVVGCISDPTPTPTVAGTPIPRENFTPQAYTCLLPNIQDCGVERQAIPTPQALVGGNMLTVAAYYIPTVTPFPATATPARRTAPGGPPTPTPLNVQELDKGEREVAFSNKGQRVFGTYLVPQKGDGRLPAILFLNDRGVLDRNGNSSSLPGQVNTIFNFARTLGNSGYISLRYDKLGTGRTGLGDFATNPGSITLEAYLEEAKAAYDFLRSQPEVDPNRVMLIGHGEGALLALLLANQLPPEAAPKAIGLLTPYSQPYLDIIRTQYEQQFGQALQKGLISQEQYSKVLDEVNRVLKSVGDSKKIPSEISLPDLRNLLNPLNEKYVLDLARANPLTLTEKLNATPVLLLCGQKDFEIACKDVKNLGQTFEKAGNSKVTFVELENTNHVFKVVPGEPQGAADYYNPNYNFSSTAGEKVVEFVKANL